ncbi:MAG: hypothetical protein JNM76_13205 [Betaproteobacteria bacterium]|nr:hypothetical protein [Betaproteobacteria bacterium]
MLVALQPTTAAAEAALDCACVVNKVDFDVRYEYTWGDKPWTSASVNRGNRSWFCWTSARAGEPVPPLRVRLDVDLSDSTSLSTYNLPLSRAGAKSCDHVQPTSTFHFAYRANTNKLFMALTKSQPDPAAALARPAPSPYPTMSGGAPVPPSAGAASGAPYGCACVNSRVRGNAEMRARWGDGAWEAFVLQPGYSRSFCWRYAQGSTASPALQVMLDVELTDATRWVTYNLDRVQSTSQQCNAIGVRGQYDLVDAQNPRAAEAKLVKR